MTKFEQTHDPQIWGKYVTKITIFGFWAVFRGLVQASDTTFQKSEIYLQEYSSSVTKNPT